MSEASKSARASTEVARNSEAVPRDAVAIIPARGGSKGLPGKNIMDFCGKPLLAWSILQAKGAGVESVYVSSDDAEILAVAEEYGAGRVERPADLSGDAASSESAWLHAIEDIGRQRRNPVGLVLAMQATSPLRSADDIAGAFQTYADRRLDSLFSASPAEDLLFWEESDAGELASSNYNFQNRGRRQDRKNSIIENGSFYIFTAGGLRENQNRLYGRIGYHMMDFVKLFEIDDMLGMRLCKAVMQEFILDGSEAQMSPEA